MRNGICRLCLQQTDLCESHIIPEFLYKELYDPSYKNRIHVLHTAEDGDDRPLQKGYKEPMLCSACEGKFHEKYVSSLFFAAGPAQIKREAGTYSGIDYDRFKLFQMSVLWRAGVAQGKPWQYVRLGKKHSEALRLMLLNGRPGEPWQYGCLIIALRQDGKPIPVTIWPVSARDSGYRCYQFTIAGMVWYFFVGSHPAKPFERFFLQRDGTVIVQEQKFWDNPFIRESAGRIRKQPRFHFQPG